MASTLKQQRSRALLDARYVHSMEDLILLQERCASMGKASIRRNIPTSLSPVWLGAATQLLKVKGCSCDLTSFAG